MTSDKKRALITGFTCGSFDLLHAGHALMLEECKKYCDFLIVGLHTDPSKDRSEKNSPVQSLVERKIVLSSIKWVDKIVVYETENDLYNLLSSMIDDDFLDVRIIGDDWKGKKFTGHDLNLKTTFNSRNHNYSTSNLRKRIHDAQKNKEK